MRAITCTKFALDASCVTARSDMPVSVEAAVRRCLGWAVKVQQRAGGAALLHRLQASAMHRYKPRTCRGGQVAGHAKRKKSSRSSIMFASSVELRHHELWPPNGLSH